MDPGLRFLLVLAGIGIAIGLAGFRVVEAGTGGTIVTLGKAGKNVKPGYRWVIPVIQRIDIIDTRIAELNPELENILTSDGVPVRADLFFTMQVVNPRKAQFDVRTPSQTAIGLVRGMLVEAISSFTSTELVENPQIRQGIGLAVAELAEKIEEPFGVKFPSFSLERLRLPPQLEQARTDVRVAEMEKVAALTRANMEAEVTGIERGAQGLDWVEKTKWDTLAKMAEGERPPFIIVGPSTGAGITPTSVQTAITAAMAETLEKVQRLLENSRKEGV